LFSQITHILFIIQEKLIEESVIKAYFACELSACKGACCWEGDYGGPMTKQEAENYQEILEVLLPELSEESQDILKNHGTSHYFSEPKFEGTPLRKNGACVYLRSWPDGSMRCSIEIAYNEGKINYNKPISCHLYPLRIDRDAITGFELLSYHKWSICSAACQKGKKSKTKLYEFVKDALVRKYGNEFYHELEALAIQYKDIN